MLDIRESVSAATHGVALLVAIPAVALMIRRATGEPRRRLALAIYGFSLTACLAASTVSHALVFAGHASKTANTVDHIGIFLLIAGTYTPIVATLLPERRRRGTLIAVWSVVVIGVGLNLVGGPMHPYVATSFYLAMGWGSLYCYFGVRERLTTRQLALIPLGGVLYSVGAMFHVARWPVIWPGVFGSHELFHLFVVAGAAAHFAFLWRYVAGAVPAAAPTPIPGQAAFGFTASHTGVQHGDAVAYDP